MRKFPKQAEATICIQGFLASRNLKIEPGIVLIGEDEPWHVFDHQGRCIGIAPSSGLWVGPSGGKWERISEFCSVGSALEAIEYLIHPIHIKKA
jgi:hypothetical protein